MQTGSHIAHKATSLYIDYIKFIYKKRASIKYSAPIHEKSGEKYYYAHRRSQYHGIFRGNVLLKRLHRLNLSEARTQTTLDRGARMCFFLCVYVFFAHKLSSPPGLWGVGGAYIFRETRRHRASFSVPNSHTSAAIGRGEEANAKALGREQKRLWMKLYVLTNLLMSLGVTFRDWND